MAAMATAEAAVLRVVRAGRLAHLLQRQAHFLLWKDAAPMSSSARRMTNAAAQLERLGAVRADERAARPTHPAVPRAEVRVRGQWECWNRDEL